MDENKIYLYTLNEFVNNLLLSVFLKNKVNEITEITVNN